MGLRVAIARVDDTTSWAIPIRKLFDGLGAETQLVSLNDIDDHNEWNDVLSANQCIIICWAGRKYEHTIADLAYEAAKLGKLVNCRLDSVKHNVPLAAGDRKVQLPADYPYFEANELNKVRSLVETVENVAGDARGSTSVYDALTTQKKWARIRCLTSLFNTYSEQGGIHRAIKSYLKDLKGTPDEDVLSPVSIDLVARNWFYFLKNFRKSVDPLEPFSDAHFQDYFDADGGIAPLRQLWIAIVNFSDASPGLKRNGYTVPPIWFRYYANIESLDGEGLPEAKRKLFARTRQYLGDLWSAAKVSAQGVMPNEGKTEEEFESRLRREIESDLDHFEGSWDSLEEHLFGSDRDLAPPAFVMERFSVTRRFRRNVAHLTIQMLHFLRTQTPVASFQAIVGIVLVSAVSAAAAILGLFVFAKRNDAISHQVAEGPANPDIDSVVDSKGRGNNERTIVDEEIAPEPPMIGVIRGSLEDDDVPSIEQRATFMAAESRVVSIDSSGDLLLIATRGGEVGIWKRSESSAPAISFNALASYPSETNGFVKNLRSAGFLGDKNRVYAATGMGDAIIFDVGKGADIIARCSIFTDSEKASGWDKSDGSLYAHDLAWLAREGTMQLVIGFEKNALGVFNIDFEKRTCSLSKKVALADEGVRAIAASSNAIAYGTHRGNVVILSDLEDEQSASSHRIEPDGLKRYGFDGGVIDLQFSDDGGVLAALIARTPREQRIIVFKREAERFDATAPLDLVPQTPLSSIDLSSDGAFLFGAGVDGSIHRWSTFNLAPLDSINTRTGGRGEDQTAACCRLRALHTMRDLGGRTLILTGADDGRVVEWLTYEQQASGN